MIKLLKIGNSSYNKVKQLVMQGIFGKSATRTAIDATPHGIDSRAFKGMVGCYMKSEADGSEVLMGYLHKDRLAEVGETRIFSTDANGILKAYLWLKSDGKIHFLGSADNLVRYSPLNTGVQQMKSDINAELTKIQTAIGSLGGSYVRLTIAVDISGSKHDDLKTS